MERAPDDSIARPKGHVLSAIVFTVAIFANATLLFAVQPMFTKLVLPRLGGSPAIWNTCLLFFQTALLAGYLYAHVGARLLSARTQALLHLALLFVAMVSLPVGIPAGFERPVQGVVPIAWLITLLIVALGAPFTLVAAGAPILQRWFASTDHPRASNPYFLYAASNLGSFVALLSYPFLIEPHLRLVEQRRWWSIGYLVLLGLLALCAAIVWRASLRPEVPAAGSGIRPSRNGRNNSRDGRACLAHAMRWGMLRSLLRADAGRKPHTSAPISVVTCYG